MANLQSKANTPTKRALIAKSAINAGLVPRCSTRRLLGRCTYKRRLENKVKIRCFVVLILSSLSANHLLADNVFNGKIIAIQNYTDDATGYCGFIVKKSSVTGSSNCAQKDNADADFYYRWNCSDESRKGMFSSALAAYMGNKNVLVQVKSGDCEGNLDRPYSLLIQD